MYQWFLNLNMDTRKACLPLHAFAMCTECMNTLYATRNICQILSPFNTICWPVSCIRSNPSHL